MNKKYKEIVNLRYVTNMKVYLENSVDLWFINGNSYTCVFKTPEEAQEMMKRFEAWCVFGNAQVSSASVVYEDELSEEL